MPMAGIAVVQALALGIERHTILRPSTTVGSRRTPSFCDWARVEMSGKYHVCGTVRLYLDSFPNLGDVH